MKVSYKVEVVQLEGLMIAAFDVAKDELTLCWRVKTAGVGNVGIRTTNDACKRNTSAIEAKLRELSECAQEHGYTGLLVVCEATGKYEQLLMRTATRLGHRTAYVSGEAVAKSRVIEFNDTGKTDLRDPEVIASLAERGKLLVYREPTGGYDELKAGHRWYLQADEDRKAARIRIDKHLVEFFPDLKKKRFLVYGATGEAIIDCYGFNPYRIAKTGFKRFASTIRKRVPRVRETTLKRVFDAAVDSARHPRSAGLVELLEKQMRELYAHYLVREANREEIRRLMVQTYERMRKDDPKLPPPTPGVINAFGLARFFAETGPLSDFSSVRKLMRYAGLNLRECASGTYKGANRITKKGSALLRLGLNRIVFPLLCRSKLFGEEYHRRKDAGVPGAKAQAAIMRKMLRVLYGWYHSGQAFDHARLNTCQSQYKPAA